MKQVLLFASIMALLIGCNTPTQTDEKTNAIELISEELRYYPLTELDSVYSVGIRVKSQDTAVVKYTITLTQELETYKDSLVLDITAGQEVTGQIIFPNCRVKNHQKPSFNSKLTVLEN